MGTVQTLTDRAAQVPGLVWSLRTANSLTSSGGNSVVPVAWRGSSWMSVCLSVCLSAGAERPSTRGEDMSGC